MSAQRILFLALSGVRVRNEDLMRKGLTLPGFVERSRVIASLPSLGLLTLAAHTPSHWDIEYRECDDFGPQQMAHWVAQIVSEGFSIVAISALSARVLEAYCLADALRREAVTVILGGLHVSALPDEAARHADAVVQGEGEAVWPSLLEDWGKGELRPLYSSFSQPFCFQNSRVPRYDLLDIARYNRLTLQTTRGCPLDCAFCAASRTISNYKKKPLAQIRRELEAILAIWPRPFIELADDNTFVHRKWARELAALLAEYKVPYFTETDISVADDDELLELLADSNCAQLLIGLESLSSASLKNVDRAHWKLGQREHYAEKIAKIQSYGISVNGCFVLGFDEDGPDVFERTRDWILSSELAEVQITLLTPFPNTRLHRQLEAQNRLLEPIFWNKCTLFDATFRPAQMSVEVLEREFGWLMEEIYRNDVVAQRRRQFRACRRARKSATNEETA